MVIENPDVFYKEDFDSPAYIERSSHAPKMDLSVIEQAYRYTNMFAQLHPGFDCLVLPMTLLDKVVAAVGNVFTGFPPVGSVLAEAARVADPNCVAIK
jgi:hypothetical protein